MTSPPRYRFGSFVLSPAHRRLLDSGREVALIPRYLDLLLLLVGRRREAVSRREILATAWSDVVVGDGALNQAIRTLRQVLGDDSREPRYLRTVSRHGYQFVFPEVVEEADDLELPSLGLAAEMEPAAPVASGILAVTLSAAWGGALAGVVAALVFGLLVLAGGGGPAELLVVLMAVGAGVGFVGAAGVGGGLAVVAARVSRHRGPLLLLGGALGGVLVGTLAQSLARWTLDQIFGLQLAAVGGAVEGAVLGAAAGLGIALTRRQLSAASGRPWRGAVVTGSLCAVAAVGLTWSGHRLSGESLELVGRSFAGSNVGLMPLARVFGEDEPGVVTHTTLAGGEGLLFGIGLAWGLARRGRWAVETNLTHS